MACQLHVSLPFESSNYILVTDVETSDFEKDDYALEGEMQIIIFQIYENKLKMCTK